MARRRRRVGLGQVVRVEVELRDGGRSQRVEAVGGGDGAAAAGADILR